MTKVGDAISYRLNWIRRGHRVPIDDHILFQSDMDGRMHYFDSVNVYNTFCFLVDTVSYERPGVWLNRNYDEWS